MVVGLHKPDPNIDATSSSLTAPPICITASFVARHKPGSHKECPQMAIIRFPTLWLLLSYGSLFKSPPFWEQKCRPTCILLPRTSCLDHLCSRALRALPCDRPSSTLSPKAKALGVGISIVTKIVVPYSSCSYGIAHTHTCLNEPQHDLGNCSMDAPSRLLGFNPRNQEIVKIFVHLESRNYSLLTCPGLLEQEGFVFAVL